MVSLRWSRVFRDPYGKETETEHAALTGMIGPNRARRRLDSACLVWRFCRVRHAHRFAYTRIFSLLKLSVRMAHPT